MPVVGIELGIVSFHGQDQGQGQLIGGLYGIARFVGPHTHAGEGYGG